MKIGVAGLGYVGLSNAVLLSQKNEVYAFDINQNIVEMLQNKISHIKDAEIEDFLAHKELNLHPTNDTAVAYKDAGLCGCQTYGFGKCEYTKGIYGHIDDVWSGSECSEERIRCNQKVKKQNQNSYSYA